MFGKLIGGSMGIYSPIIYVITMLTLTGCSTVATAPQSAFMPLGEAAMAPVGYLTYCARRPDDCRAQPTAVAAARPAAQAVVVAELASPQASRRYARLSPSPNFDLSQVERRHGALESAPGFIRASYTATDQATPLSVGTRFWIQPGGLPDEVAAPTEIVTDAGEPSRATNAPATGGPQAGDAAAVNTPTQDQATKGSPSDADAATAPASAPLPLNRALLDRLNETNRRINFSIIAKADVETFGDSDYWHLPLLDGTRVGDCKDFVLEKRRALIAAGVPEDALAIAIVQTRRGEGHAVLLVATDQGEYVLDNLSPWVTPWRDVDYRWMKRQVAGQPLSWVRVGGSS